MPGATIHDHQGILDSEDGSTSMLGLSATLSAGEGCLANPRRAGVVLCAAAGILLGAGSVAAQDMQLAQAPPPAPPSAPQPAETARPKAFEPGFLDAVGRFLGESVSDLNKGAQDVIGALGNKAGDVAKGTADAAKDAAGATADAVNSAVRLPAGQMTSGRARCVPVQDGAPDCQAAAEALCRSKGFATGSSVDIQSEQKCSAQVWLSGRGPSASRCRNEPFVTRALCQ
jgi:hypothetical protein